MIESDARAAEFRGEPRRLTDGWEHHRGGLGGIWEVWRGDRASHNVPWTAVTLPHCMNAFDAVDPDRGYYQGPGWYRTRLALDRAYPPGARLLLRFEGVGQKSEIFVGMEKVDEHVGGYDEFIVDITDAVERARDQSGGTLTEIPLAVACDNGRDLEMIPSNLSDFTIHGGIYRTVSALTVPAVSLERVHVDTRIDGASGAARVVVRARLRNPRHLADALDVHVEVRDPQGRVAHESTLAAAPWTGSADIAAFNLDNPALWSPDAPALYTCAVTLRSRSGESTVSERFGLRHFEFLPHGPFKLNGQRLLIRGTQRHEDHAGLGAALTDDIVRRELTLIKEMGANFIRLGHYPQSRLVLDLCDQLGILVWEEIPWCRGGLGGARHREQARRSLRAIIDQHRNHPSVILWGLGNENDWPGDFETFDPDAIRAFMRELHELAHELDPSRKTAIRRCDFCKDVVDVYSPSIWAGWYRGRYTEYKASSEEEMAKVDHFLHMEWGGDSHAGRHAEDPDRVLARIATGDGTDERDRDFLLTGGQSRASKDGDWSETYICNLYDWHLKEQETMPSLTGAAQWIFKDFATPLRPGNPIPRVNQKGLCERDLTPKEGYFVFQSYWTTKPMLRLYGHSWPVRWGARGEAKMVKVYSNCAAVELFVNGESAGTRRRDSQDFPAAGLRWLVPLREGDNELHAVARQRADGGSDGAEISDRLRLRYQTAPWSTPARFLLEVGPIDGDAATVHARLVDGDGVPCLDARNVVRFGLAGDGRLLDNLGTNRGARQVELANGRAQISVALEGGVSTVSVSAHGLPTAFVTVGAPPR